MDFPKEILHLIEERSIWINKLGFKKFKDILSEIPDLSADSLNLDGEHVELISSSAISHEYQEKIKELAERLIPWKKGPFKIFGLEIEAEWRSNLKWQRIEKNLPELKGKRILDIGANNGYYMFKMSKYNPAMVLGIDPIMNSFTQFNFIQRMAKIPCLYFELLGIEHLKYFNKYFDVIFSMGIIYHHRSPIDQLKDIKNALTPSGTVILETVGIPGSDPYALFPQSTYANMKNIWFIPTLPCLENWARKAGFSQVELLSVSQTSGFEQRNTPWYPKPFQTLEDFLDKNNQDKTIEGFPSPLRFCLKLS